MSFLEIEFPTSIAFQAQGGPGFSTTVNQGFSGYEQRNRNWPLGLGKWKIELYNKPLSEFEQVYALWLNAGGRASGFRFKDHKDFRAIAEVLGVADGVTTQFQLLKTYAAPGGNYVRDITKPVTSAVLRADGTHCENTVTVYADGVPLEAGIDYNLDFTTGLIDLLIDWGSPPATITADFQFHYPVRFDNDDFMALIEESDVAGGDAHVSWPNIGLVEVRPMPTETDEDSIFNCPPCVSWIPVPAPAGGANRIIMVPSECNGDDGSCGRTAIACDPNGIVPGAGTLHVAHCSPFGSPTVLNWSGFQLPSGITPERVVKVYRFMEYEVRWWGPIAVGEWRLAFGSSEISGSGSAEDWWLIESETLPEGWESMTATARINCTLDDPPGACWPCGAVEGCSSGVQIKAIGMVIDYV